MKILITRWAIKLTISILQQRLNDVLNTYDAASIDDIEDVWDRDFARQIDNAIELIGALV